MSFKSHKDKTAEAAMYSADAVPETVVVEPVPTEPVPTPIPTSVPPEFLPGTIIESFNGKPILVGDTVALVCKVIAIDPLDAHYGEIQCTPIYPGLNILFIPNIQAGQVPQSRAYVAPTPEGGPVFGFHPKQLVEWAPPELPPDPPPTTLTTQEVTQ